MIGPYKTPQAFRVALETRLRQTAQARGVDLQRLQRQVAFERLMARLFANEIPPWLLKGGYSLELRHAYRRRSSRPGRMISGPAHSIMCRRWPSVIWAMAFSS